MTPLFDLKNRVALVVGGGGYLGRPCCEALADHGARVIVADRNEQAAIESADHVERQGGSTRAMALDVGDERSIDETFSEIEPPDILVNLAAFSRGKPLDEVTREQWEDGLRVTLTGAFLLSRAAANAMGDRGGSIVHFTSMYGQVSPDPSMYEGLFSPNPPDYGAAKAGIIQLTRNQAVNWAHRNIRVNAIAPGPFPKTFGQGANPEFVKRLSERTPMKRVGRPEEIAGAVVYLCSDASSYVTGTTLSVDGGWTAW